MTQQIRLRKRVPWLSLGGIVLVMMMTFGNAAANMMPQHVPTRRELQRAEQDELAQQRRERIATLLAEGDGCHRAIAIELARALVFDGQSAVAYADDYERRCGEDPAVRHWADVRSELLAPRSTPRSHSR